MIGIAAVSVLPSGRDPFGRMEQALGIVQDPTGQHDVERQLCRSAHGDELPSLANRRSFHAAPHETVRDGAGFALLKVEVLETVLFGQPQRASDLLLP